MTTIKSLLTLIILSCFVSTSFAQVRKKNNTAYTKNTTVVTMGYFGTRTVMPAHKLVWVFSTNGVKAHWERPKPNELKNMKKQKAEYSYDVNLKLNPYKAGVASYVRGRTKAKPIKLTSLKKNTEMLMKNVVSNHLVGKSGKKYSKYPQTMVSYFKNINAHLFSFNPYMDHIVVTDTLFVPFASTGKATFVAGYQNQGWAHIKIIANCIVYESPLMLSSMGSISTDFVFASNKYIFKSIYKDLPKNTIQPPLYKSSDPNKIKGFKNKMNLEEKILLNRLYVYTMEEVLTTLNSFNNKPWKKDLLLAEFQSYRFNRTDRSLLNKDTETKKLFDKLCIDFNSQYGDNNLKDIRDADDFRILVEGEVSALPGKPFKYHSLPTKASLLPVNNQNTGQQTALGFIHYNPTGESKFELKMAVNLSYDQVALKKAGKMLNENGLVLQEKFPAHLAEIKEQKLKINGKTLGEIIPIGNQNVRFEIELTDDPLSLYQLFTGPIEFEITYSIKGALQPYSQIIKLDIDPSIIDKLNPDQIMESFSVIEKSSLTEKVMLSSQLDRTLPNYEALNYVEVTLEFNFENRTVSMGPYRLSSHSLEDSKEIVDFIKYSKDYTVKVSGQAVYENGKREIKPFLESSKILVLDESIFE
ncbi:MAG: hypothetical protein ACI9AT_000518 [Ulvibacter sp.]|jgi:hypothetical protein